MNERTGLVLVAIALAIVVWFASTSLRDKQLADIGQRNHSGITPADSFGFRRAVHSSECRLGAFYQRARDKPHCLASPARTI